jgi:hypothetical protein
VRPEGIRASKATSAHPYGRVDRRLVSSQGARFEVSAVTKVKGDGTKENPWVLKTPPGTAEYEAYRDDAADPPALVVQVGKTQLRYHLRCIDDLAAMLRKRDDWMPLGSADEQRPAAEGTVESWGRAVTNPVGGWYGLEKGLRGRFGMYVPPVLEALGYAEVEHNPKNNRMRGVTNAAKGK